MALCLWWTRLYDYKRKGLWRSGKEKSNSLPEMLDGNAVKKKRETKWLSMAENETFIDVSNICECPRCGGMNTTTGTLCMCCSLEDKLKDESFRQKTVEMLKEVISN